MEQTPIRSQGLRLCLAQTILNSRAKSFSFLKLWIKLDHTIKQRLRKLPFHIPQSPNQMHKKKNHWHREVRVRTDLTKHFWYILKSGNWPHRPSQKVPLNPIGDPNGVNWNQWDLVGSTWKNLSENQWILIGNPSGSSLVRKPNWLQWVF